jgi:hypothetical protein
MKRTPRKEVDDFFSPDFDIESRIIDPFVESVGGKRVEQIFDVPTGLRNPDYYFHRDDVFVELKILTKEFMRDTGFAKERTRIINQWFSSGHARPEWLIGKFRYPELEIQILKILSKKLKEPLASANRQIKDFKAHFAKTKSKGVVLFVNDGFYDAPPKLLAAIIGENFQEGRRFSSVECFIIVNLRRQLLLADNQPVLFWTQWFRGVFDDHMADFIHRLGEKWFPYLEKLSGVFFKFKIIDTEPGQSRLEKAVYSVRPITGD